MMIQGQRFTFVNINCIQFSHIAFVGCLIVLCGNPFFFVLFDFFFIGERCNDQRVFSKACVHSYACVSFGHAYCLVPYWRLKLF